MADITSRDFQELIKRQKETTDRLETIVDQNIRAGDASERFKDCLLYTSPSPRDCKTSRMPSSA